MMRAPRITIVVTKRKVQNNEAFSLRKLMVVIGINQMYVRLALKTSKKTIKCERTEATRIFQIFLWIKMATHPIGSTNKIRTYMKSR